MNTRLFAETRYLEALTNAMHRHAAAGNMDRLADFKLLATETLKRIDKLMKEVPCE